MIELQLDKRIINDAFLCLWDDDTPMQISFGGSSGGKSRAEAQRIVKDMLEGGRNYLCVRKVAKTIKQSIFNEICKVIRQFKVYEFCRINQSDFVITFYNDFQILFAGLDDVEKIKSITPIKGVITDIWIEEATETSQTDLRQLMRRLRGHATVPKRIMLTFNPIMQDHWISTMFFAGWDNSKNYYKDDKIVILKTTYKDNLRFLDQSEIDILENETDKYWYDVYTLGNWGVLGNLIFKNWEVRDLTEDVKHFDNYKNGLDFGFSSDPAAVVRTHYDKTRKIIYIVDEIYMREMTNDILAKELSKIIEDEYIICDSAEPKSIRDLRMMNIRALAARKGKDSVNFGIDWLQRQKIVIDSKCQHAINEFRQYKWKEDKDGNVLKVPIEKNDHLIDALRYAYENDMESRAVTAERSFM